MRWGSAPDVAPLDGTGAGAYGALMDPMTEHLITQSASVIRPQRIGDRLVGDVGCAVITDRGHVYLGVCLDTASRTGFCAEASAIAAMVTAGEFRIHRIVAMWKDENARLFVVSPCGRCREFIRQLHADNLGTEIVLGPEQIVPLSTLLSWPNQFTPIEVVGFLQEVVACSRHR